MLSKEIIDKINSISDEYIVIGVSAGPDSMALLHMLINNIDKKIVCAHVNHNVRASSKNEEKYLKEYCKKNNIIFECTKITKYTEQNFENEARNKRYAFYEEILNKYHSHYLLLAHHGDDLIETVLMKIIRGSNLEGYAGIKTISKLPNYTIIRPLLNITKEDILKYNKNNNIKYYIDNTNDDTKYTRNRYRKTFLPLLKEEASDIHLKFLNYSNTLQEYYNYVFDMANEKITNIYKDNTLDITLFNKEPLLLKKQIIFNILSNIYGNQANIIKNSHIDDIINLANSNKPNQTINLPDNYVVKKSYNKIIIDNKIHKHDDYRIEFQDKIKVLDMIIEKVTSIDTDGNNVCRLNTKDIKLPLYIRNKRDGDYIEVLGLNGKKKIKDIFIEKKIPQDIRNNYPLLVDADDNILWIPNIKKSKYNVKNSKKYDIILTSYKEREEHNEKETK